MYPYFTKSFWMLALCVVPAIGWTQGQPDSLREPSQKYGLRAGLDLSKLLRTSLDDDYTGLELVGDYRLSEKLFVAAELGSENKTTLERIVDLPLYRYNSSGAYLKAGVNINNYKNWFGEQNLIYFGLRYALSTFKMEVYERYLYDSYRYYEPDAFVLFSDEKIEYNSLSASWIELVTGFKAEVLPNIYMGMSARIHFLLSYNQPDNFDSLWIPGFNKKTDNSRFGLGYNYSISYFLPLYKKPKKNLEEKTSF